MPAIVVDSYGHHTPAELTAINAVGTVRYLNAPKAITKAQYQELRHGSKGVAVIIERSYNDWVHGYQLGKEMGIEARNLALALDPEYITRPVGVAVDDDIHPKDLATASEFVRGFHEGAGLAWLYGTAYLIDYCFDRGYIQFGMQSCSTGFYDNSRISAHSALHQHCGHNPYDYNDILAADWGQLPRGTLVPVPQPSAKNLERDMLAVHGVKVLDDTHNPVIYLDPKHPDQLVALYCAPFAEIADAPDKVQDGPGVQVFHLSGVALSIAPNGDAVDVLFDNHEVHKAGLKPGITVS
jgi:hypothetical protein